MAQVLQDKDILEEYRKLGLYPRPGKARLLDELAKRVSVPFTNEFTYKLTLLQLAPTQLTKADTERLIYPQLIELLNQTAIKHFGRFQNTELNKDLQLDRLLGCVELIQHQWWKTPTCSIVEYKRCFAECEAVLQLRRFGAAVESMLLHRSKLVYYFVIYMTIYRQLLKGEKYDFTRWWFWNKGNLPTPKRREQAAHYFSIIREILRCAGSTPYSEKILEVHVGENRRPTPGLGLEL